MTVNKWMPSQVDEWLGALGHLLLPPRCLVCAEPGEDRRDLCAACTLALPYNVHACLACGLPLPAAAGDALCGRCLRRPPPFAATVAPLLYAAPLDRLLPRLKFHADLAAGRVLADLLGDAVQARLDQGLPRPQALVPVPLHRARLRERGYDQALELARPLARRFGLPLRADLLRRTAPTRAQSRLDAAARARNVRRAFSAASPAPAHVALVDDVMTTGATLGACAHALLRAGAERIDVWVVARA
ncbi:ComF family protein [Coralloluteibacterium thermophilus]|uniref:ComF family protein n=1 Tax=Coralloluteibacterium thermophilum TaxID=2707049 RepID=A0ABV9NKB3_9GAMM